MERSATNAGASPAQAEQAEQAEQDTVVVHVQLRPRRGATRKCLAALASLAAEHEEVSFSVSGLSKDDRVVRVTVGVELGPRTAVAKFSPQAQAAYAFVSAVFATLYDHMPVYTAEPGHAERAAATVLLEQASRGVSAADVLEGLPTPAGSPIPGPRESVHRMPGERIPA